jgi:hypothetical protein
MVDEELERIWKEVVMTILKNYPDICLEGLRRTIRSLS